jgi:tetratricopeptide (TPR) repeat protein
MVPVEGERNQFREPVPHGIGCERCHGPGELHVRRWKESNETPTGEPDPTIAHPRRLPNDERQSVCFQCHLGDAKATVRVGRPGRDLLDYRPGQPLSDYVVAFHYTEQTQSEFGLSSQADRMILSRCFVESAGRMECLTCHDPHVSAYHERRPPDYFSQRCVGCHGDDACDAPEHERARVEPANDCVACHMRKAEADDQRFAEFTDHWIRKRIDFDEPDHRQSHAIEPVDPDHFNAMSKGEQAFYLARAHSLLAMNLSGEVQRLKWAEAVESFVQAIDDGHDTVDAWFFLGKARQRLGRSGPAKDAFQKAYTIDPVHHDAAFAFGQASFAAGEVLTATEIFERMLQVDPDDPMALAELGRAYTGLGRLDDALSAYEQALASEPWNSSLHMNRGMLLAAQTRFDDARDASLAAVRLNADGIPEWEFHEKLMRAMDEPGLAGEAQRQLERLRSTSIARD